MRLLFSVGSIDDIYTNLKAILNLTSRLPTGKIVKYPPMSIALQDGHGGRSYIISIVVSSDPKFDLAKRLPKDIIHGILEPEHDVFMELVEENSSFSIKFYSQKK